MCPSSEGVKEVNVLWELDHVGILPEEIRNKSKEVLRHFENTVNYSPEENPLVIAL